MPSYNYGELPPHPIEAKRHMTTPEGWASVAVVGERELFETTPSNQTRAEQFDAAYGADKWGVTRHEMADGSETQLLDVIADTTSPVEIEVQGDSETFQIPVSHETLENIDLTLKDRIARAAIKRANEG